jgi:short-subunit dehydrogenase
MSQARSAPKTAFITGASSGIGRELAERLAARGVLVGLAARRRQLIEDLAAKIVDAGGRAVAYELDVADTEATAACVEHAWDELEGIDLVVANAGMGGETHATELTWDIARPMLQTNVMGAIATLLTSLPRMVARGHGHLVGVTSLAAMRGLPTGAVYGATKAALAVFLEGLRIDLAGTGIAVTEVRPGFVDTPILAGKTHPMPMKKDVHEAVDIILRGIDARAGVVAFPTPLVAALGASRLLPNALYDAIVRSAAKP